MASLAARLLRPAAGAAFIGGAAAAAATAQKPALCEDKEATHPPRWPFWVKSIFHSTEIPSVRRGYEIYRQVCSTCHSMKQLHFRHLVNQVLPEKRMKQIAAGFDVRDGPDDQGEYYDRPGLLTDAFPAPFPNEEAARYANGGALPPDLSVYATAKHEGVDYIFSLLLGYREPPHGIELRQGLYYNPYFAGGLIGMPPPLDEDGLVDFEDGTPCTKAQCAKDITNFICWASEPTHDERKLMGLKGMSALALCFCTCGAWYRAHWIVLKTRRIDFTKAVTL